MNKRILLAIGDQVLVFLAFLLAIAIKGDTPSVVLVNRFPGYLILWGLFFIIGLFFDKYNYTKRSGLKGILLPIIQANFVFAGLVSLYLIFTAQLVASRALFFGTTGIVTMGELIAGTVIGMLAETRKKGFTFEGDNIKSPDAAATEPHPKISDCDDPHAFLTIRGQAIRKSILDELGENTFSYLCNTVPLGESSIVLWVNNRLNILALPTKNISTILNLQHVNDHQYVNKFFEAVNLKLPPGGIYAGCGQTKEFRKKRFLKRYTPAFGIFLYSFDFLFHRVCPKMPVLRKFYFAWTKGKNRVMSRAEILGRLCSCGFEIVDETNVDNRLFFVTRKVRNPVFDDAPSYGPLICLQRVGKDNNIIGVYKLRTMHPFSEYLQAYVNSLHGTIDGGKFKNDFRVTTWGRIMRKLWIDELPMLANWARGDMKLVGVRPLSLQKFNAYPEHLQKLRVKYKPGLVPPYYADMVKSEEELFASEEAYIRKYEKAPLKTDATYLFRAAFNIIFRNARSN